MPGQEEGKKKLLSLQPEGGPPREEIGEGEEKAKRGVVEWRLSLPRLFFAPVSLGKTASWHRERGDRRRRSPFFLLLDVETFSVRFGDDLFDSSFGMRIPCRY